MKNVQGLRFLLTGASTGLGKSMAFDLARQGADLVLVARRAHLLEELSNSIRALYPVQVQIISADLSDPSSIPLLFSKATQLGKLHGLINNAGTAKFASFGAVPFGEHLNALQVNLITPMHLTHLFLEHISAHKEKSYLLMIASMAAFHPTAQFATYSATKHALKVFSEILKHECHGHLNLSITCCCPGGIATPFFEQSGQKITEFGKSQLMSAEHVSALTLEAMLKEKDVFVPGWLNQVSCFLPRLLPRNLSIRLASYVLKKASG